MCSSVADDELMQDDLCPNCFGDEVIENDDNEVSEEILSDVHEGDEESKDEE